MIPLKQQTCQCRTANTFRKAAIGVLLLILLLPGVSATGKIVDSKTTNQQTSSGSSGKELHKSLTSYFSNVQRHYQGTKQWSRRAAIYDRVLIQFAKLLRDNAKAAKGARQIRLIGTVSGLIDLHTHMYLLEEEIYQGQWEKRAGQNLRRYAPAVWQQTKSVVDKARLEYFKIKPAEVKRRNRYLQKMVFKLGNTLKHYAGGRAEDTGDDSSKGQTNQKAEQKQQALAGRVFLYGYRSALKNFIRLNKLLEGEMSPGQFASFWAAMLQGKKT